MAASALHPELHLFQIVYSPETKAALEPGYLCLDNMSNSRPDWFEYWPIRKFLIEQKLDDNAFYGFFSTKFYEKTTLRYATVEAFVREHAANADVILFSTSPYLSALFLNVFEQGNYYHPGILQPYMDFLTHIGLPVDLPNLIMDSRQTVFSNYFVARPAFWRAWLALNEMMFAICEGPDSRLKNALCAPTKYAGSVQRKVFLQERVASLLLATQPKWRSIAHNLFNRSWSPMPPFRDCPQQTAVICDALKTAYLHNRYPEYIDAYAALRKPFFA